MGADPIPLRAIRVRPVRSDEEARWNHLVRTHQPTYYQTALHELGHWTGHGDRLNREALTQGIRGGAASPQCAREELWAEVSSMMMGLRAAGAVCRFPASGVADAGKGIA